MDDVGAVVEQLRMGRDHALLGNYMTAKVYYDQVIAALGRLSRGSGGSASRDQWLHAKEQVQTEVRVLRELTKELGTLRQAPSASPPSPSAAPPAASVPTAPVVAKPRLSSGGERVSRRGARGGVGVGASRARKGGVEEDGGLGRARGVRRKGGEVKAKVDSRRGPGKRGAARKRSDGEERAGVVEADGGGKVPYSEAHGTSADIELIRMVERDILDANPNVAFSEIAGLEEAKGLIQEAAVLPLLIPDFFKGIRRPWKGVLMFGPPGTGKTMLAKAVATECASTFFNVTSTTLTSKWRGESERIVRILFEMARYHAPSVIFLDEIDALASARGKEGEHEASRRVKTELLVQMDGVSSLAGQGEAAGGGGGEGGEGGEGGGEGEGVESKQVLVLAATNLPWELDEAFRRRLEKRVFIPLPSQEDREALFALATQSVPLAADVDLHTLASATEGYSGADITVICRDAAMQSMRKLMQDARRKGMGLDALREHLQAQREDVVATPIAMADFQEALRKVSTSVGTKDLERFKAWMKEFGAT